MAAIPIENWKNQIDKLEIKKTLYQEISSELNPWAMRKGGYYAVKEAVLPFNRFPGVDTLLGPEMRSTGEVMGIDPSLGLAFMKSQIAAGQFIPNAGCVFISVNDHDKEGIVVPVRV